MFKLNIVLKIVSVLYNNFVQETTNQVLSSLTLFSDVVAARSLTLSKQLYKLKCTGGDRCTQLLKFEQKWQSYLREQQQMHATKNGVNNEPELL